MSGEKNIKFKSWKATILEILKWALVLWLLLPLRHTTGGSIAFWRVVLGILLFIILAGKLFYDTIITEFVKQRRTSVKQDIVTLIGLVLVIILILGFFVFFMGFVIVELMQMSSDPKGGP